MITPNGTTYSYRYDNRNRCIYKHLPGSEPIYLVYDNADRLIFSQDGEQRAQGKWRFHIPDSLGRECITGFCTNVIDYTARPFNHTIITATRTNNMNSPFRGYIVNGINLSNPDVWLVNYYDNYSFLDNSIMPERALGYEDTSDYGQRYVHSAQGLQTGRYASGNGSSPTRTAYYYDDRGRVVQSLELSLVNQKEYRAYDFSGQMLKRKFSQTKYGGNGWINEYYTYAYDHAGRLTKITHQLDDGKVVTLSENTYDELGRLKTTKANDRQDLQLTYTYNIRDWVTGITGTHFKEHLYYNTALTDHAVPAWNGNIATVVYDDYMGFDYTYDYADRLTKADNWMLDNGQRGLYSSAYEYDKNGNMTAMVRLEDDNTEDFSLTLRGNQMYAAYETQETTDSGYGRNLWYDHGLEVDDYYRPFYNQFQDYRTNSSDVFLYNRNGALIKDPYKGDSLIYDLSGRLTRIDVPAVIGLIRYSYDGTGRKVRADYQWHNGLSFNPAENTGVDYGTTRPNSRVTYNYFDNKVYDDRTLKQILLPNGYISDGKYYFYMRDHLGNNCVVQDEDGQVVQRTYYHPYGKPIGNSEGQGMPVQPYKYGGKELESLVGLTRYDFGARQLDYTYNCFTTRDPLEEQYYTWSPYVYCGGNPIKYIDPDGREKKIYLNTKRQYAELQPEDPYRLHIYSHGRREDGTLVFEIPNALPKDFTDPDKLHYWLYTDDVSEMWVDYINSGKNNPLEIVLHACYSSKMAQKISKRFPNTIVTGTSDKLFVVDKVEFGPYRNYPFFRGYWITYIDGIEVMRFKAGYPPPYPQENSTDSSLVLDEEYEKNIWSDMFLEFSIWVKAGLEKLRLNSN